MLVSPLSSCSRWWPLMSLGRNRWHVLDILTPQNSERLDRSSASLPCLRPSWPSARPRDTQGDVAVLVGELVDGELAALVEPAGDADAHVEDRVRGDAGRLHVEGTLGGALLDEFAEAALVVAAAAEHAVLVGLVEAADLAVADEGLQAVAGVVADVRLHGAAQLFADVLGAGDGHDVVGDELFHRADHDLGQQFVLGGHVLVEARASDAHGGSDVAHGGGPVALCGEEPQRGLPDRRPAVVDGRALGPRRSVRPLVGPVARSAA